MPRRISCYPPLDKVTVVRNTQVTFLLCLEIDTDRAQGQPWEAALWCCLWDHWAEYLMSPVEPGPDLVLLDPPHQPRWPGPVRPTQSLFFSVRLQVSAGAKFTVKFRSGEGPWRWIRDHLAVQDGTVILNLGIGVGPGPCDSDVATLQEIISGLHFGWRVCPLPCGPNGTAVWRLETQVGPALAATRTRPASSAEVLIPVGLPFGDRLVRWFATVIADDGWIGPRHGRDRFDICGRDAIMSCFLNGRGRHLVLLPLSGINHVNSVLRSGPDGVAMVAARNDGTTPQTVTLLAAVGDLVGGLVAGAITAIMNIARAMVTATNAQDTENQQEIATLCRAVDLDRHETWYNGLGYCTWNSLGQRLTDEKIHVALHKLTSAGIHITTLIIDDGWQALDRDAGASQFDRAWVDFEADPASFPQGLKSTVAKIRREHRHIIHIAVWHALLGYWGGVSPRGRIAGTYGLFTVPRPAAADSQRDGPMLVVAQEGVADLYDKFYQFLAECGIDAVKTDAQYMVDTWVDPEHRRDLARSYMDAWTKASLRHFGGLAISCMSHVPLLTFSCHLPQTRPMIHLRNSHDFYPDEPDSHAWHLWANAYNCLTTLHLNVIPDWDMFDTARPYSAFHAAARCLSGGPVYISDKPGEHDVDLIRQMTGTDPAGRTVTFRPDLPPTPVDVYAEFTDKLLLKMATCYFYGKPRIDLPMIGIFNISAETITEIIPADVFLASDLETAAPRVVRSHRTGIVSRPIGPAASPFFSVTLPVLGYDILTTYPLFRVDGPAQETVLVANLGLVGKLTGAAAIVSTKLTLLPEEIPTPGRVRVQLDMEMRALGIVGIYISSLPCIDSALDLFVFLHGLHVPLQTIRVSTADSRVLEIDIETAWEWLEYGGGRKDDIKLRLCCLV